jgi:hypothetical protein
VGEDSLKTAVINSINGGHRLIPAVNPSKSGIWYILLRGFPLIHGLLAIPPECIRNRTITDIVIRRTPLSNWDKGKAEI